MTDRTEGWAPQEGATACGYKLEIEGETWRCVKWKHTDSPHYVLPLLNNERTDTNAR